MVYVSYHIFEHYSSVRNLAGPHKGLPRIKETQQQQQSATSGVNRESNRDSGSIPQAQLDEMYTHVTRSLPPNHGIAPERIYQLLRQGDPWESIVDQLVAELAGPLEEPVETSDKEGSLAVVDAGLVDTSSTTNNPHQVDKRLVYREPSESLDQSSACSTTAGTPTGSTDGREIRRMGRPRKEAMVDDDRVVVEIPKSHSAREDSLVPGAGSSSQASSSATGSTVSLAPSTPDVGESTPSTSKVVSSVRRPHGHKRQLTFGSTGGGDPATTTRRVTRSRKVGGGSSSGGGGGAAGGTTTRKTYSVLGKNMKQQTTEASHSSMQDASPAAASEAEPPLRGKEKRNARKRRAEISRRERIEAEAWGLGCDDVDSSGGGVDGPDESIRRTRGDVSRNESAVNGIKELYI